MGPTPSELLEAVFGPPSSTAAPKRAPGGEPDPVSRQIQAMVEAWRRGDRPRAEEYLAQLSGPTDEEAIRIVYEEACLRQEAGESSVSSEIFRRFPEWRSKLELLLDGNRLLRSLPDASFPEAGEEIGDFRLLAEIGRGAAGRTYLASQRSLAHRTIVLKATALGHDEHLCLARLQHMHIVPLYFEQVIPERSLRVLGMPHLGGTSLARILESLWEVPAERRSGRLILEALDRRDPAPHREDAPGGPFRKFLAQASYVQAICWIGACLADALQYAHERGLVHMDVKPSNVLLASDGQPMLLDFHLAGCPLGPGRPAPDRLGGTPAYMAPEQRDALSAIRKGRAIPRRVDGRADIYSLGLLLYQALGGAWGGACSRSEPTRDVQAAPPPSRPLERCNPAVSPGLSDLIARCLSQDPGARYPDAASLAVDLRRHLNDLPLLGVSNRSLGERWAKWRRRRPASLSRGVVGVFLMLAVLSAAATVYVQHRYRVGRVRVALEEARVQRESSHFRESLRALERGLALAGSHPGFDALKRELAAERRRTARAEAAAELKDLVRLLRFRTGMTSPSRAEASALYRRSRQVWDRRALLATAGDDSTSSPMDERQIRTDLLDLATISAALRIEAASPGELGEARREALELLLEAAGQFGTSPSLSRDLRALGQALGRDDLAASAAPEPTSAWEHYDLGLHHLRSGELRLAEQEFRRSVARTPGEFWPNFFLGVCAYRLGHHQDAATAFTVGVALAPDTAECYFDRALALEALGLDDRAIDDYGRALDLNPRLWGAAFNRGILRSRQHTYGASVHDLEAALAMAPEREARGRILYQLALVNLAQHDRASAKRHLREAVAAGNEPARGLLLRAGVD